MARSEGIRAISPGWWRGPSTRLQVEPGVILLVALASLVGVAFVIVVPPGLPYDEPSHWENVLYYAQHGRMPRIGDPAVSYEAQMGPLAYVVDALVAAPLRSFGNEAAFYAVRVVGLLELLAFAVLVSRQARRATPHLHAAPVVVAGLIALNPMLLAMSTSVQNDTLALVLAVLTVELASAPRPLSAGAVAGAALLAKITVWPVVIVAAVMLIRRGVRPLVSFGLAAVALSAWWFLRNIQLYGDLTGRRAVKEAGFSFPTLANVSPVSVTRSACTYLWLPTEYVRNLVESPTAIDVLVVALSLVGFYAAVSMIKDVRNLRPPVGPLVAVAVLAVAGWLVTIVVSQAVAFRFAYVALPAWFLGFGYFVGRRRHPLLWFGVAAVACLGISTWFLVEVSQVPETLGFRISLT